MSYNDIGPSNWHFPYILDTLVSPNNKWFVARISSLPGHLYFGTAYQLNLDVNGNTEPITLLEAWYITDRREHGYFNLVKSVA